MHFEFTPAAQRALAAAAAWTGRDDDDELRVPEVLLGLLVEPECRAALMLAAHGIDEGRVRQQFPHLRIVSATDPSRQERFSAEWTDCLHTATSLLMHYPPPLELATEHLLLGIAASENDVARWLAEQGLSAAHLEAEVHRLSGYDPNPLPIDDVGEVAWSDGTTDEPMARGDRTAVMRAIDAAANRAGEGLRVIEDYLRFVLDDKHLTSLVKSLRHELTTALAVFPAVERHASRDTLGDVGTTLSLVSEQSRETPEAIVAANFKRVEQSLRTLEEFAKSLEPNAAMALEQLRYRVYTLERAADLTHDSLARLQAAGLYVLVDGRDSLERFGELVASLIASGVSAIQLRDKRMTDRELLGRARLLARLAREGGTLSIINDRADLALLADADGVHVGQDELTVTDARRILGPRRLVGVSTHSLEQARSAVLDGANYIGVGPTFPSATKEFASFTGVELLQAVEAEIRLPAFAIGGITLDNLPQVLETGFRRVAVSSAVVGAADPARAARQFLNAIDACQSRA